MGARLRKAEDRVAALASVSAETSRLKRMIAEAQADPVRAEAVLEDVEVRLRLLEGELADLLGGTGAFGAPSSVPASQAPDLRRAVVDEFRAFLASEGFRELCRRAAREAAAPDAATEDAGTALDAEMTERQIASLEATVATLQDRLSAVPGPEAIEAAVRRAGEALDHQLAERLAGALSERPPAAASGARPPEAAAFLEEVRALVQQAVSDSFPMEEIGRIIDQKVAKRSEGMRDEIREIETALVKATMSQLESKPLGEAQVAALIERKIRELTR